MKDVVQTDLDFSIIEMEVAEMNQATKAMVAQAYALEQIALTLVTINNSIIELVKNKSIN